MLFAKALALFCNDCGDFNSPDCILFWICNISMGMVNTCSFFVIKQLKLNCLMYFVNKIKGRQWILDMEIDLEFYQNYFMKKMDNERTSSLGESCTQNFIQKFNISNLIQSYFTEILNMLRYFKILRTHQNCSRRMHQILFDTALDHPESPLREPEAVHVHPQDTPKPTSRNFLPA